MSASISLNHMTHCQLGRLVVYWNDLEAQMHEVLLALSEDSTAVAILLAKIEVGDLFNLISSLSIQYDACRKRLNTRLAIESDTNKIPTKLYDQVSPHISYLVDSGMQLKRHRDFYVEGVRSAKAANLAKVGSSPALCVQLISPTELKSITAEIIEITNYAAAVCDCIRKNDRKKSGARPRWPTPTVHVKTLSLDRVGLTEAALEMAEQ
jgi:hypothetical protein